MSTYDDFDELVSAYLDGEATADEVARVEADPDLSERVTQFRLLGDAIAEPIASPSETDRDAAITAALAAVAPDAAPTTASSVSSLDAARVRRAERNRRFMQFASVAAAIAFVVIAGTFVFSLGGGDDDVASETTTTDTASDTADSALAAGNVVEAPQLADDGDTDAASEESAVERADAQEAMTDDDDAMADDAMVDDAMADEASADVELDEAAAAAAPAPEAALDESDTGLFQDGADDTATEAAEQEPALTAEEVEALDSARGLDEPLTLWNFDLLPNTAEAPAVEIAERPDYVGEFDTLIDFLIGPALELSIDPEDHPLIDGPDCPALDEAFAAMRPAVLAGVATIRNEVTGALTDVALVALGVPPVVFEDAAQPTIDRTSVIAIDIATCDIAFGRENLG